jgi:hypothetical protein
VGRDRSNSNLGILTPPRAAIRASSCKELEDNLGRMLRLKPNCSVELVNVAGVLVSSKDGGILFRFFVGAW